MRYLLLLYLLLIIVTGRTQPSNELLEDSIKSLKTTDQVRDYWSLIHRIDQANRGKYSDEMIDLHNFKRVILMIKYFGYPKGFCYGCFEKKAEIKDSILISNFTPNIVFTHQYSALLKEYFFPIFYKAYVDGIANEFWFLHNLRGLTLRRFDRAFYPKDKESVDSVLMIMRPFLKSEISFDILKIDSLHFEYKRKVDPIIQSIIVFECALKPMSIIDYIVKDKIRIYKFENEFYVHVYYRDGSYNMPQKILYDSNSNSICFDNFNEFYFFRNYCNKIISKKNYLRLVNTLNNNKI